METISEKANNAAKVASEDFAFVEAMNANGEPIKISKEVLKGLLLKGIDSTLILDSIFVVYKPKNGGGIRMVNPTEWTYYQDSGETADGVAIMSGSKILVISPTESREKLKWSTKPVIVGTEASLSEALADMNGKGNTDAMISHAECNHPTLAAGYCNAYGMNGISAGKWWLPSIGELMIIFSNLSKINYVLSLIAGSDPISDTWYWSSSEANSSAAYYLSFVSGTIGAGNSKSSTPGNVRAVTTYGV